MDTWQFSKKKIFPCHSSFYMKGSLQQGPVAAEMWWNAVMGLAQWSLPWIVSAAVSCEMLSPCQIRNCAIYGPGWKSEPGEERLGASQLASEALSGRVFIKAAVIAPCYLHSGHFSWSPCPLLLH